jgi:hypothetical protein
MDVFNGVPGAGRTGVRSPGRVDPQLLGEDDDTLPVHLEGMGLLAASVEGEHQQLPQALVQRVLVQESGDLGDGLAGGAEVDLRGEEQLGGRAPLLVQASALRLGVGPGDIGQRVTVPQCEAVADAGGSRCGVARSPQLFGVVSMRYPPPTETITGGTDEPPD